MRFQILKSLAVGLLLSGVGNIFSQEVTTFIIKGQVVEVEDQDNLLEGGIKVGDAVKGRIKFHHAAADQNVDPTVGDYRYHQTPGGMWVKINRYLFKPDPAQRDFLVELVNRPPAQLGDALVFRSYENIFPLPLEENHISWQLDDPTGAALADVNLPSNINLAAWQQVFALVLEGTTHPPRMPDKKLFIRATITKVLLPQSRGRNAKR